MKRRLAKKIIRYVNSAIVDWRPWPYSVDQERRATLVWHRAQRDPARRYGRWDPRAPRLRREHERKGYVFPL